MFKKPKSDFKHHNSMDTGSTSKSEDKKNKENYSKLYHKHELEYSILLGCQFSKMIYILYFEICVYYIQYNSNKNPALFVEINKPILKVILKDKMVQLKQL